MRTPAGIEGRRAMSDRALQIQPGESVQDFIRRIADTAPRLTPAAADRIRTLLPIGPEESADRGAARPDMPAAA